MTTFRTISGADWALSIERARRLINPVASQIRAQLERTQANKKSLAAETSHLRKKESK